MKFKTTINCHKCVAKVQDSLDELVGKENWNVDTTDEDRVLTIENREVQAGQIQFMLLGLGFKAQEL